MCRWRKGVVLAAIIVVCGFVAASRGWALDDYQKARLTTAQVAALVKAKSGNTLIARSVAVTLRAKFDGVLAWVCQVDDELVIVLNKPIGSDAFHRSLITLIEGELNPWVRSAFIVVSPDRLPIAAHTRDGSLHFE